MRRICFISVGLVAMNLFLLADSRADIAAGPFVNPNNGHTYFLLDNVPASNNPNPFDAALLEAQTLGGHLATVNDATEDAWIFSTFDAIAAAASPASNRKSLLIGLTDRDTEGIFEWTNGDPFIYSNWNPGQPQSNTPNEDYVGIALSTNAFIGDGKWHDIDFAQGDVVFAVVEVAPVPEPSNCGLVALGLLRIVCRRRRCLQPG